MSATTDHTEETDILEQDSLDDLLPPGMNFGQPLIRPGQTDRRATHYAYSAGEQSLKTRAADTGYAVILPGRLYPLRGFEIKIANDTVDSLFDENAPKQIMREVTPYDAADALMARYQHRGMRILFPLTGREGPGGERRAAELFRIVHPKITCSRSPKELPGQCVFCRLEDLNSQASLDRIERAKLSQMQNIPYGTIEGEVRYISEEEVCTIMHELILSANEELMNHMIETLAQSKADVEAGKSGPGKKGFDKRDRWYMLNTHIVPEELAAIEAAKVQGEEMGKQMTTNVAQIVAETVRAMQQPNTIFNQVDVQELLEEQERRHQAEQQAMEARFKEMLDNAIKKDSPSEVNEGPPAADAKPSAQTKPKGRNNNQGGATS